MMKLWEACQQLTDSQTSFVIVTMTHARGSSPQDPGSKIIVTKDGLYFGTVGGGRVEMTAINKGREILETPGETPPETVTWNLQKDIGMTCGGEVTFLFEHFPQNHWNIVVFGAGHVGQALTRVLNKLNCNVTCVDPRTEWIAKLEGVKGIHHPDPKELVSSFDKNSYFIIVTMGHADDVSTLIEVAKHAPDCPYVGVIGSKTKATIIRNELTELGIDSKFIEKVRVPMGLIFGSTRPYEIAISIAAEVLQVRDQVKI